MVLQRLSAHQAAREGLGGWGGAGAKTFLIGCVSLFFFCCGCYFGFLLLFVFKVYIFLISISIDHGKGSKLQHGNTKQEASESINSRRASADMVSMHLPRRKIQAK